MKLIAIDPGARTGIAIFTDGVLTSAYDRAFDTPQEEVLALRDAAIIFKPNRVVVEMPVVYPIKQWKGDPNDLITVAIHVGVAVAVFSPFCAVELATPRQWKGQRPKAIDNARTLRLLSEDELERIEKKNSTHALDAIGLGLWALKRS